MSDRLNVVYIHSHDTGRCMEPYGYPMAMPAYRRIANEGIVFRNAFSAAPTCSPSRAALLTGQAPHSAGMLGLAHRGFALRNPNHHLAAYLSAHGYRTVLAGHQHLTTNDPRSLGYDTVLEITEASGEKVAANAVAFLRGASATRAPFFLDVGFSETHRPFRASAPRAGRFVAVMPGLPDIAAVRSDTADFHASLSALDRAVGDVIDALDESGLADQTLVVVTTDHGPPFPGYKATLTDRGLGVGLILRLPGMIAPGQVADSLVSQIDLFPTICELSALPVPEWAQGYSLVPLLTGAQSLVRTEIFGEVTFHAAYEPQRSIRTDRWLYVRRFDERADPVLPNIDQSPALDWMLDHGWGDQPTEPIQLYDNATDPFQKVNLATTEQTAWICQELDRRLVEWMRDTGDPLLDGPVALPPFAVVNRAGDRSPDGELVREDYR